MPTPYNRAYSHRYRQARKRLLATNPPCHWCGAPATTADHDPPLALSPRPHMNLVPACTNCNYGIRRQRQPNPSRQW